MIAQPGVCSLLIRYLSMLCSIVLRRLSRPAFSSTNHVIYVASLVLVLFSFPHHDISPFSFSPFCSLAVATITHHDLFLSPLWFRQNPVGLPAPARSFHESSAPTDPISANINPPWGNLMPPMPHSLGPASMDCSTIISKNVSTSPKSTELWPRGRSMLPPVMMPVLSCFSHAN